MSAASSSEREAEIRVLAATNGRRLMGDGHYSTVMLGWPDIQMLLDKIDRLREQLRSHNAFRTDLHDV